MITFNKADYEMHKASGTLDRYRGVLVGSELDHLGFDFNYQIGIGFDQDTKPEEYAAFQSIRAKVKRKVDDIFTAYEASKATIGGEYEN